MFSPIFQKINNQFEKHLNGGAFLIPKIRKGGLKFAE